MDSTKTLPREPWRGSMICGEQMEYGVIPGRMTFCGNRKADGLYLCDEHWDDLVESGGCAHFAPGNALGADETAVRLLWEPMEGDMPIEASADEIARYAAILDPVRGE